MKNNNLIITIVIVVVVGVVAFLGGMHYQKSRMPSFGERRGMMFGGSNGQMGQRRGGGFQGFRPVSGEIISQDDDSVTVKMQDGSSKIVILSDQTTINKASEGAKSDLKSGERIIVFGFENPDGSVTAQNISIGGNMMFRGASRVNALPTGGK